MYRRLRSLIRDVLDVPSIKKILRGVPAIRTLYSPWERKHPFDVAYKIETSGFVPVEAIHPDRKLTALINAYAPSQPGIVRQALSALGDVRDYAFADLGCGKGRVTVVASEFAFREIVGIDLSPALTEIARANAAVIARKYPERCKVQIFEADVLDFPYPAGKLVVFLYHPFGREILSKLILKLEARLSSGLGHLFFVYYNPVHGDLVDQSPAFQRWYAECVGCQSEEREFGPDASDAVVIWQSVAGALNSPHKRMDRAIIAPPPTAKADLEA